MSGCVVWWCEWLLRVRGGGSELCCGRACGRDEKGSRLDMAPCRCPTRPPGPRPPRIRLVAPQCTKSGLMMPSNRASLLWHVTMQVRLDARHPTLAMSALVSDIAHRQRERRLTCIQRAM